jgi:hypothetical protein
MENFTSAIVVNNLKFIICQLDACFVSFKYIVPNIEPLNPKYLTWSFVTEFTTNNGRRVEEIGKNTRWSSRKSEETLALTEGTEELLVF